MKTHSGCWKISLAISNTFQLLKIRSDCCRRVLAIIHALWILKKLLAVAYTFSLLRIRSGCCKRVLNFVHAFWLFQVRSLEYKQISPRQACSQIQSMLLLRRLERRAASASCSDAFWLLQMSLMPAARTTSHERLWTSCTIEGRWEYCLNCTAWIRSH